MKTYKKHLHICGQKLSTENITIKENLPFTQNRWLDYRMLEVKEFQRRGFYKYLVLTTRSFAAPGSLQKDIAFSQMITGWDRELKNNPTISQEGLFFVFCFLFYTLCPWTVSDVHSLTNHQTQTLTDTWPMAVPTQWAWGSGS